MHNYLLMGRLLQCAVVPKDEVHPELWVGANKKFRKVPRARLEKVRNDKVSLRGEEGKESCEGQAGEGQRELYQQARPRRPEPRPRRVMRGQPRSSQIRPLAQLGGQLVCPRSRARYCRRPVRRAAQLPAGRSIPSQTGIPTARQACRLTAACLAATGFGRRRWIETVFQPLRSNRP